MKHRTTLVTGASGYIGGRLVPRLLAAGHQVRILARNPERLRDHDWYDEVEITAGDAADPDVLAQAMSGVGVAYYLLHSLGSGKDFEFTEAGMATVFGRVAREQGVGRIVYLGGMIPADRRHISPHLESRETVGRILRSSGVPTIELRAAVIIGSGSASFEMLRYLTERLPVMITPRWVRTRTQPIGVRDVLHYLEAAATAPGVINRSFDIGGPDVLTYQGMIQGFADVARLPKRRVLPVNLLSPGLSSHWVGLVTPVPRGIARPLVESLRVEVVCADHDVAEAIGDPPGGPQTYGDALRLALRRVGEAQVMTRWSNASVAGAPGEPLPTDPDWAGGSLYTDVRETRTEAPVEDVWHAVEGVGGEHGYYAAEWMWEIRGAMDRVVGGVGLRRGRRDPDHARIGEALDFWRVEERIEPELLRLRAEMKVPGRAWLEWAISRDGADTLLTQTATFYPKGLFGQLYWWSVAPFHAFVFKPMLRGIAGTAERAEWRHGASDGSAGRPAADGPERPGGGFRHLVRPDGRGTVLHQARGRLLRPRGAGPIAATHVSGN